MIAVAAAAATVHARVSRGRRRNRRHHHGRGLSGRSTVSSSSAARRFRRDVLRTFLHRRRCLARHMEGAGTCEEICGRIRTRRRHPGRRGTHLLAIERQPHDDTRSFVEPAADRDLAAVQRHQSLDDRKTEAGPIVPPIVGATRLEERLANPRKILLGDADAAVLDRHHNDGAVDRGATATRPPWSVNLMAFERRLIRICLTARLSATRSGRSGGTSTTRSSLASRAFRASRSQQPVMTVARRNGSGLISKSPVSSLLMSRMPFTTDRRCAPESWIRFAYSRRRSGSSRIWPSFISISEKPMMALSGVRSSWLTVARKRLLSLLACSASVRASSIARSCDLRSVTSRITATTSRPPGALDRAAPLAPLA